MHQLFGGQALRRVEVHDTTVIPKWDGLAGVRCFGAMALFFEHEAMVIRSPLRYGQPDLDTARQCLNKAEASFSHCSHEEAKWLQQAIGRGWTSFPHRSPHALLQSAARLLFVFGDYGWMLDYRPELDGLLVWRDERVDLPKLDSLILRGPVDAFGWLLPESPYPVHWGGKNWPNLQTLWLKAVRTTDEPGQLYRELYRLRLNQHPNLLRRFKTISVRMRCPTRPWVARQLYAIREEFGLTTTPLLL